MGKGSWSGIWEMFAALVFYDLVTTMVMIMWKDGEVLAVQCVSALVAGAVFLFFYIRKKKAEQRGEPVEKKVWKNHLSCFQIISLAMFGIVLSHQRPDRSDSFKIHIPRLPSDRPGNRRTSLMASDPGSGSGDSMDRRTDFPGLWFLTAAAISFLLDSHRDFDTRFRCLSWKCGTGPLCSCDRSVS